MSVPKLLTVSYIQNQFGPPGDLKAITSKNAAWERVENNLKICGKLERLDLDSNSLSSIAPVFDVPLLSQLSVSHNRVIDLIGIYRLGFLKQLNVSHNELTSLDALTACTELRVLIANNNHLTRLPVPMPKNLACLVVSHNELTTLEGVETLTQLTKLSASHNALTQLPGQLTNLTKLCELRVNHNLLTTLPSNAEFGVRLARMKLVDLGNNRFSDLDALIAALQPMHFLRNLNLKGNPVERRGQPLEEPEQPQGPNSHFLHTAASTAAAAAAASSSSSAPPALPPIPAVTPANSVSAPSATHPPAYFVALSQALPLLAILDTKKVSEHEIKFRHLAEAKARGSSTGLDKRGKEIKSKVKLTTDKTGKVIELVKGMKKNEKRAPLPTLAEVEKGVTMTSRKKSAQKPSKRAEQPTSPPTDADAAAAPSTARTGKLQLPAELLEKNAGRKQKQREKKAADLLQLQLSSGGEGAKQAEQQVREKTKADKAEARAQAQQRQADKQAGATSPSAASAPASAKKKPAAPASGDKKRKREDAPGQVKKAKPFSTMAAKAATLAAPAPVHAAPATPSKGANPAGSPKLAPKSPKASGQQQQQKQAPKSPKSRPLESVTGSSSQSEQPAKKQKVEKVAPISKDDSVVQVVRSSASSFSVDALNSTYSKVDHVGASATVGWSIDTTPHPPKSAKKPVSSPSKPSAASAPMEQ